MSQSFIKACEKCDRNFATDSDEMLQCTACQISKSVYRFTVFQSGYLVVCDTLEGGIVAFRKTMEGLDWGNTIHKIEHIGPLYLVEGKPFPQRGV